MDAKFKADFQTAVAAIHASIKTQIPNVQSWTIHLSQAHSGGFVQLTTTDASADTQGTSLNLPAAD